MTGTDAATAGSHGKGADGEGPRVRLAQLAAATAEADSRSAPGTVPSASGAPRHAADETNGIGRLVERWGPGSPATPARRRATVVAAAVGVLTVVGVVVFLTGTGAEPERPPPLPKVRGVSVSADASGGDGPGGSVGAVSATAAADRTPTSLVVSVVGKVTEPGLVTVSHGARVAEVIERVGGADDDADLLSVNLARRVADGEQIYVGVPAPPGVETGEPTTPEGTNGSGSERIDLNTADQARLETLPGVGEVTAGAILDWRSKNGAFTSVEQLREVDGIGEKRLARLRDHVRVE